MAGGRESKAPAPLCLSDCFGHASNGFRDRTLHGSYDRIRLQQRGTHDSAMHWHIAMRTLPRIRVLDPCQVDLTTPLATAHQVNDVVPMSQQIINA